MDLLEIACKIYSRLGILKNHWPVSLLEYGNMKLFRYYKGYSFDLNHPQLFTEKVQWYKTRFHRDDIVRYVDKFLFKDLIKEKLGDGYTITLLGSWTTLSEFRKSWNDLPDKFCLKSTLQSDGKYIKIIEKDKISLDELCSEIKEWLKPKNLLINSFCTAYHKAIPRIIAEEYMESIKDQLFDYKYFCFNGSIKCIYVAQDHFGKDGSHISFYDLNWNKLDVKYGNHIVGDAPCPKHYQEMVEIAKKLSQGFPFIRVDFFDTDEKLYVAELTFYPGGGFSKFQPDSFDKDLGSLFKLL